MGKLLYSVNHMYFDKIDTYNKAYILGIMFADGHMYKNRKQIRLKLADIDILENIKNEMEYTGPLYDVLPYHKDGKNCKGAKILTISSSKIYGDLIKLGCIQNKTYNKEFPNIDDFYMSDFIRGYFDGNGCFCIMHDNRDGNLIGEMVICSTVCFCNGLNKYLNGVGIHSSLFRDKNHDNRIGKIRIRRLEDLKLFYKLIYDSKIDEKLYLKRKYNKYSDYMKEKFGGIYVNN